MTPLRERMIADMTLAGLAAGTQSVYVQAVRGLAAHYRRSPDQLSEDAAYTALEGHPDTWRHDPGYQRSREQRARAKRAPERYRHRCLRAHRYRFQCSVSGHRNQLLGSESLRRRAPAATV